MDTIKRNKLIYWAITLLVVVPMAGSGIPELFLGKPDAVVQTMHTLGYPLYIMKILGLAKILGGLAICVAKSNRLKEWAYAGFTFDLLGATASHILAGDAEHAPPAFFCLVLLTVSYVLWRKLEQAPAH